MRYHQFSKFVDDTKKRRNSARLPSKIESCLQSWPPRINVFCDFPVSFVWSIAPATKKWGQFIRSAAPVTQNPLSRLEDLMLQNATPLRKSAPTPPNKSDSCVSCTAPAHPTPANAFESATKPSRFAHFFCPALATQNHISTSKSAPNLTVVHSFDFKMCFLPQRRALFQQRNFRKCSKNGMPLPFWLPNVLLPQRCPLFRHLNFQKRSKSHSFSQFWLRNVLPAKMACTFSTAQLPKVLQEWCACTSLTSKCVSCHNDVNFFDISTSKTAPNLTVFSCPVLTSKCASRHNGVQLFISHVARWLRTRRFSEPPFWPAWAQKHWENTAFFLLTLSLLWSSFFCLSLSWIVPPLLFHLSMLSEVSRLNFLP